jgi:hypothetical protein
MYFLFKKMLSLLGPCHYQVNYSYVSRLHQLQNSFLKEELRRKYVVLKQYKFPLWCFVDADFGQSHIFFMHTICICTFLQERLLIILYVNISRIICLILGFIDCQYIYNDIHLHWNMLFLRPLHCFPHNLNITNNVNNNNNNNNNRAKDKSLQC